jgi:hypothetical protein
LFKYKNDTGKEFTHAEIFENPEVVNFVSNIVLNKNNSTPHISKMKPDLSDCNFKVIGMHSPADLDVYDSQGRHVGINKELSNSDFQTFDTEIPGSDFYTIGDEKFAIVPDENSYTVKIDGLYTLDIKTQSNDQITKQVAFGDLPVTPNLKGSLILDTQSTSEPVLSIDYNGDGIVDQEVTPNNGVSPLSYLELIRATILELDLSKKLEKSLITQIDRVIILVKKDKVQKATDKLQKFLKRINFRHTIIKEMTQEERANLIVEINNFLSSL